MSLGKLFGFNSTLTHNIILKKLLLLLFLFSFSHVQIQLPNKVVIVEEVF